MSVITFDTHALVKKLKESGFAEAQAEVLSDVLKTSQQGQLEQLVTKRDLTENLKELEIKIQLQINELRHELHLVKWMAALILTSLLSLVIKAFFI